MKTTKYFLLVSLVIVLGTSSTAAADSSTKIMITLSDTMHKIIFDGKWTTKGEWKESSLNEFSYGDGTQIKLRTAHESNFIYVMIDDITAINFERGSDRAIVCFDKFDNKTAIPNNNDYCFVAVLDAKKSFVLQGGSPLGSNSYFKKIEDPTGKFIGIGSISDQNDRYSVIPHTSYEFRIPTELVGRSVIYGFYVDVYDSDSGKIYSWPQEIIHDSPLQIPSPANWGEMISPDNSLPEFPWPTLALLPVFFFVIYLTQFRYYK